MVQVIGSAKLLFSHFTTLKTMEGRSSCNKSMISNDVQGKFTLGWLSGEGDGPITSLLISFLHIK